MGLLTLFFVAVWFIAYHVGMISFELAVFGALLTIALGVGGE